MKKYIIYLFAISLAFLWSCDDILEKEPFTSQKEEAVFKDIDGAYAAIIGMYNSMTNEDYYGRLIYAYEGSKGPDFFCEDTGNRFLVENGYRETSAVGGYTTNAWSQIYSVIFKCNDILFYIDKIEADEDEINVVKGQAYAVRALCYFDLMRLFAYPPIFSFPGKLHYNEKYQHGVPLILSKEEHDAAITNPPGRNTSVESFNQIVADFKLAIGFLDGEGVPQGHIGYDATCTLLSRAYLYMEEWQSAIDYGLEALDEDDLIKYEFFAENYYKPFNKESLFELAYSATDDLGSNSLNHLTRAPTYQAPGESKDGKVIDSDIGYAGYGLNKYARALLRSYPGDIRTYLICDNNEDLPDDGEELGYRKNVGRETHSVHNITVVRTPEPILNIAEAYAALGNASEAVRHLNMLAKYRLNTTFEEDVPDLFNVILDERHKEFILEGQNYWDKFRRNISFEREDEGSVTSDNKIIEFEKFEQVVYPIPQNEMERNKNIRGQQNPGYEPYTGQ